MFEKKNINFITLLRGPAALLVVFAHLVGEWLEKNQLDWAPFTLIREYVTAPLAIIQNFGFFGVVLFFIISGYIVTHVSQSEKPIAFMLKRIVRIYPPLILSILLILASYTLYKYTTGNITFIDHLSITDYLLSFTLVNYVLVPQIVINGVAWTLLIEMLFYVLCFLFIPLMKKNVFASNLLMAAFCLTIIFFARSFGDNFFLLAASVAYIPYLLMGQLLYYWNNKIISFKFFALLSIFNYIILTYGIKMIFTNFYDSTNSYGVSFLYAYLLFVVFMLLENRIRLNRICSFFSNISYSLYLNHGTIGALIITVLYPFLGYSFSLLLALSVTIFISFLSFRFVEEPSRKFARYLVKKKKTEQSVQITTTPLI